MEARIAGSEQVRVRMLKQPHIDANKIERIKKFCRSTDPYTLTPSPWQFSRVREEIEDGDCAMVALSCDASL